MDIADYIADFFAALFLCNCIPHIAAGLMGEAFPSPFASPPGKGNSSPTVNFLWGAFNLIAGCALCAFAPFGIGLNVPSFIFFAAFILGGTFTAWNFGKVRQHPRP